MKTKKVHNSTTKKVDDGVSKGLKVSKRGKYTNWFQSDLWPPIMVAIKKYHGNWFKALHFFQTAYKKLGCLNVYETLSRFNICEWFINIKNLKSNYNHATEMGSTFQCKKHNLPVLE